MGALLLLLRGRDLLSWWQYVVVGMHDPEAVTFYVVVLSRLDPGTKLCPFGGRAVNRIRVGITADYVYG